MDFVGCELEASLAGADAANERTRLLAQLDALESRLRQALGNGMAPADYRRWQALHLAINGALRALRD